jgi:signal transduction histidine kinase
MSTVGQSPIAACVALTRAISRATTVDEISTASLDALAGALGASRAAILLFDADGVMRFTASRGLSSAYCDAVEGHSPWRPDSPDAQTIVVADVASDPSIEGLRSVIQEEGIAAMAFIPLVSAGRVIGKFMVYYGTPRTLSHDERHLAELIAAQVAFAVDRARLRRALDARLAHAEEDNELKDQFLATLSHELRTPLNAILGWAQVLEHDISSPERVRHAIDIIRRNARQQAQLIEDILDVSRIITGKLTIEMQPLDLGALVDMALSGVMPVAALKHIDVVREVPDDLPVVRGDAKRLQQVLSNVLSNAIKFTSDEGLVRVSCAAMNGDLTIEVRDTGVGIAPELLPFVFDRFRQGDSRSTRRHGGLGLGLAIARHLVERHGGEIRAHSDGVGTGTTFLIRLPVAESGEAVQPSPLAAGAATLDLTGLNVLVVDDQEDSRELLVRLLHRCGATVLQSSSAHTALEAMAAKHFDLLVADIAMPDVDGYELIEQARRLDDGNGTLPAIAVTAYARKEDRDHALASGYDGYCPKPLDAQEFMRVVDRLLRVRT